MQDQQFDEAVYKQPTAGMVVKINDKIMEINYSSVWLKHQTLQDLKHDL